MFQWSFYATQLIHVPLKKNYGFQGKSTDQTLNSTKHYVLLHTLSLTISCHFRSVISYNSIFFSIWKLMYI